MKILKQNLFNKMNKDINIMFEKVPKLNDVRMDDAVLTTL